MTQLDSVLASIQVPPEYSHCENIVELDVLERLDQWKRDVLGTLRGLGTRIQQERASLSLQEQGDVISATSAFDGEDEWVTAESRSAARDILARFTEPPLSLVVQILQHNVKPIFRANPHPSINRDTGRMLSRPAGGPSATQDFYDAQTWKNHPGAANTVLWCVKNIPDTAYEEIWHLVIPPVMALLDDYETQYKLKGVKITSLMLENVPRSLLKRTGVDSLLIASLNRCLTHLDTPETRSLLLAAISALLSLIQLTTAVGSADRFNQLCALLGDGIIGSIWPYASDRLEALLASIDALPAVLEVIGVGCARYLKVLVAQFVHPLAPMEYEKTSDALQLSSLRALSALITACPERISQWKGTILNAAARCWVGIVDTDSESIPDSSPARDTVKQELKNVCRQLALACPSVLQEEFPRFVATDARIFEGLFGALNVHE